jgi:signal transduction histidine kinase
MDREAHAPSAARAAHPLNHIIGYSEMLLEDAAQSDPGALSPGLRQVHADAQRLLTLINELLHTDASHADLARLPTQLSGPLGSVMSTVESLKAQAARAGAQREMQDLERIALAAATICGCQRSPVRHRVRQVERDRSERTWTQA